MSDEISFRDPTPEDKTTGKKLQPLAGFGQGLSGAVKTSRLNRPEPTSPQELRDIASYVASDQSVADHTERMDAADRVLEAGTRAALTTHRLRNPEQVANEARWTAEVMFKRNLERQLDAQEHGDVDPTFDDTPDADEILDSVLHPASIRPASLEDEDAVEFESEPEPEGEQPVYGQPMSLEEALDATWALAGVNPDDVSDVPEGGGSFLAELHQHQQDSQQAELAAQETEPGDAGPSPEDIAAWGRRREAQGDQQAAPFVATGTATTDGRSVGS